MRIVFFRWHGWVFVTAAAGLTGAAAVLAPLWLPGSLASGAGAIVAVVGGVWTARGTSALQAEDDHKHSLGEAVSLVNGSRLPLVREMEDPVALGVHPAASAGTSNPDRVPGFVARDIDDLLIEALKRKRFVPLVGESTAGKSRAAYELMRANVPDHRVIQPTRRDTVQAAAEMAVATPPGVLWLDDLERFLGYGGLTGPAVRDVLAKRESFIVATMRSEEYAKFSGRIATGLDGPGRDALRQGWDVLRLAARIELPRMWSATEIARARRNRRDPRLIEAVGHAREFGIAEYLAAAPQLLAEWRDAWAPATHPRGAAMVLAAVDARRAGVHRPLPMPVLQQIHEPYLQRRGGPRLHPEIIEAAAAWATTPLYATSSLLVPADGGFLAFDYLIDAAAKDRVPPESMQVLIEFATPEEALDIGEIAWKWSLIDQAESAFRRAEAGGLFKGTQRRCHLIREDLGGCAAALSFAKDAIEWSAKAFGPDHSQTLDARELAAWETGIGGDPSTARQLMKHLVADSERVLGADHKRTLSKRFGVAEMTGLAGEQAVAAQLYEDLVSDFRLCFGDDDEMTLVSRSQAAFWVGEAGDPVRASGLFSALLADMTERLDSHGDEVVSVRYRLAMCLTQAGRYEAAFSELDHLAEESASHGRLWGDSLNARERRAWCVGEAGDPKRAVRLLEELLAGAEELHAPRSTLLLGIRRALAWWRGEAGSPHEAAQAFRILLQEAIEQRRQDDMRVTGLRHRLAYWNAINGPAEDIIDQLSGIAAQMDQDLGPAHEVARAARRTLASRRQRAIP